MDKEIYNKKKKEIYLIGDVHGCYYTLLDLIEKIPKNSKIIFLGDIVDRGKWTSKIIKLIKENKNYEAILGNHEKEMIKYLEGYKKPEKKLKTTEEKNIENQETEEEFEKKRKGWEERGGKATINSYKNTKCIKKDLEYLKKLKYYKIINKKIFLTHGFGLPYYKRRDESKSQILSNRLNKKHEEDYEDYSNYEIINIFGHCNVKEEIIEDKYACIDTGVCYGNKLTALRIRDDSGKYIKELKNLIIIQQELNKKDI